MPLTSYFPSLRRSRGGLYALLGIGLTFGLASASASAQVIVRYPFTTTGDTSPDIVAPGFTPTLDLTNVPGATVQDDGVGVVLAVPPPVGSTNAANAVTNNAFWSITITNPSNFNLSSLTFDVGKGGSSDPRGFFVRSSVDGFSSNLISETLPGGAQAAPVPKVVDLSSASFQGLNSITFRFYQFTPDPAGTSVPTVDWRNVSINGGTAAPEPGSLALLGMMLPGAFGVGIARRRTRKLTV